MDCGFIWGAGFLDCGGARLFPAGFLGRFMAILDLPNADEVFGAAAFDIAGRLATKFSGRMSDAATDGRGLPREFLEAGVEETTGRLERAGIVRFLSCTCSSKKK